MDDEELLIYLGYILLKRSRREVERKFRKNRSMWVRQMYNQREEHALIQEMTLDDQESYFK